MKKALIHEASDAREIALSEMSSIAGAARIVCRVGAIACLVPAALGVVGCLQWAVGGMLDGSFAKGFILAGSRALSQAAASAGPELLSLTTPDKAASIILIDQNGSFPIARELSMLLMAWALAVAGRFFSEVASTKRPFGSVAAHRVKRIGAIAVLASIAPSLVVWAVIEALLATIGYAGSLSIYPDFQPWLCVMGFFLLVFARILEYGALSCSNKMTSCCRAVAL